MWSINPSSASFFSDRYPGPISASSGARWWSGAPRRGKRFWIKSSSCAARGGWRAVAVDVRSPINQSGVIFHDTLFDENAVCHIAFGNAYPEGFQGGGAMSEAELDALGVNSSDTHQDLMIGTETMKVIGICADGHEVPIMENGMFLDEVLV